MVTNYQAVFRSSYLVPGTIYDGVYIDAPETKQTPVLQFLRNVYPSSGKHHVLLTGATGSGKTFAAIAYVASKMEEKTSIHRNVWNAEFIRFRELSDCLGSDTDAKDRRRRIERVHWLIIDDLKTEGEGTVTKALVSYVEDLFSARHLYMRPTIITTNATADAIQKTYGDRFVSRFKGDGLVYETANIDMRALAGRNDA